MHEVYVLDANVFMAAWHDHYPPDLYPGFWECLETYCNEGRLLSIDRVFEEITSPEGLVGWARRMQDDMFAPSGLQDVINVFSQLQTWVQGNDQFLPAAKHEFAGVADGWLAAYAKVHGAVVVTNEAFNATIRRRVPLPNVCRHFDIECVTTLDMLRGLGVRFDWSQAP